MINVVIAEEREIVVQGLENIISSIDGVEVTAVKANSGDLLDYVKSNPTDIVVLDYCSDGFKVEDIPAVQSIGETKVLAISERPEKDSLQTALTAGAFGHILLCCDGPEITDAIASLNKGEKFFCGKVLDAINQESLALSESSCAPISLSKRELEIIALIADGGTNKDIAEKLFLSTHTVMTHRKNIMNKLGVKNTAGIVIYAVKENVISPNKYLFSPTEIS
ncbi:response regulator transcription factor [Flavobacteriales bacterium]|nr:response regulator transcription factor [Flavobacteriales bacterium]